MGPREGNNSNTATESGVEDKRYIRQSEMNNPAVEPITRKYTELRYQLLSYTYSLAWEAHTAGLPLMRAMWLYYPDDKQATGLGNQYMWGHNMLIAPVYTKGAVSREVYLPKGVWYDWWTNERKAGGQTVSREVDLATMPIYVRAGAIIPFDPVRQYTAQVVNEPTTLKIYRGADGTFTLYEDDGISLGYLKGKYNLTVMSWNDKQGKLTIAPAASGLTRSTSRTFEIEMLPEHTGKKVIYNGKAVEVSL
jgi:alpha-glucosidase/alpha-D-xyloside xylohydrolase